MSDPETPVPLERLLAHRAWVRRVAGALVADPARADDLAQEAWLGALESPPRAENSMRRWFRTVLLRKARDARRGEGRRARREEHAARPEGGVRPTVDLVAEAETVRAVVDAILALPEPLRTTVLLRYYEDLPPREIAARQELPVETVRTRLKRAHVLLREGLARGCDDDRERWALGWAALLGRDEPGTTEATGTAGTAALAAGAILMGAKAKVGIAVAVVLLGVGLWATLGGGGGNATDGGGPHLPAPSPPVETAGAMPEAGVPVVPDPAPAEEIRAHLLGRVVSTDGSPVPGALVTALPLGSPGFAVAPAPGDREGPARTAVAGADGRFDVGLPVDELSLLAVRATGFASVVRECAAPGEEIVLVMRPAKRLVVAVRDPRGLPVAGARVVLREQMGLLTDEQVLETDRAGEVRAWTFGAIGVEPRRSAAGLDAPSWAFSVAFDVLALTAEVRAPGFALCIQRLQPVPDPEGLRARVALAPAVRLSGRVVEGAGENPVADALVVLWWRAGEGPQFLPLLGSGVLNPGAFREVARCRSGPDGTFTLEDCPPPMAPPKYGNMRDWTPLLQAGAWKEGRARAFVDVRPGEDGAVGEILLRVQPEGILEGRVVDGAGRPVAGAQVLFFPAVGGAAFAARGFPSSVEGVPGDSVISDGEGKFRLIGVAVPAEGVSGRLIAGISRQAWGMGRGGRAVADVRLEVPGVLTTPDLVLVPIECDWVRVRVTRGDGSPVRGALVDGGEPYSRQVPTDAAGTAMLGFSRGGGERAITIGAAGFGLGRTKATPGPSFEDPVEVVVVMEPGRTIEGIVVHPDGTPVDDAGVWIKDGDVPLEDAFPLDPMAVAKHPRLLCTLCVTGPDGKFAFTELPDSPFHLRAFRNAARRTLLTPPLGFVPAGTTDVRLVLPSEDQGPTGALAVTVTGAADGRPVERAWVFFQSAAGRFVAWSGKDGVARIAEIPAGRGTLRAWAEGWREAAVDGVEVSSGGGPAAMAISLERGAAVVGSLADGAGVRVEVVPVEGNGWPLRNPSAVVLADGSFRIEGVPPGRWRLQAFRGERIGEFLYPAEVWRTPVPWAPSPLVVGTGDTEVRVVLEAAATAILFLVPKDPRLPTPYAPAGVNDPMKERCGREARLEVRDAGGALVASQVGLGRAFAGPLSSLVLPPGAYTVRLLIPGAEPREERVDLAGDTSTTVDFR